MKETSKSKAFNSEKVKDIKEELEKKVQKDNKIDSKKNASTGGIGQYATEESNVEEIIINNEMTDKKISQLEINTNIQENKIEKKNIKSRKEKNSSKKNPNKIEEIEKNLLIEKKMAPLKESIVKVKDAVAKEITNKIENVNNDLNIEIEDIKNTIIKKGGTTRETTNKEKIKDANKGEEITAKRNNKSNKKTSVLGEKSTQATSEQIKNTLNKVAKKVDKSDITSFSTYLFHQGKNYEAYNILGSHIKTEKRKKGVQFSTWGPNAKEIYVVGDFNNFQVNTEYKLERLSENGLWSGFFPGIKAGTRYKYCIVDKDGKLGEYKSDPYAIQSELRPNTASIVYEPQNYKWNDKKWINKRNKINVLEQPINIYEIHLGSWKSNEDGDFLTYEELSNMLPEYVKEMGYTHVEFMPIIEHPLDASWGYQGTGYYAPTSRYGNLEGLKRLIDKLHQADIGVILDWVPGHFCKDAHGLYKFDGSETYEYQEEWRAENRGWGTCNFDLERPEVRSYLISNALYWYREFHIDGIRVDAVSSILYLDYSRNFGEWIPNKYGGNGNLEAIDFLKELNKAVFEEYPTALMIAEESTSWPNVTKPPSLDGLGFNFKWNMGWMNDTLEYVEIDPKYRKDYHKNITFSMMYNYAENYMLPVSHDEVVHGKKSLIDKMWGDSWNKFASLRAFMGYMIGHPGKKLLFMGCEFAQFIEWREYESLQWNLLDESEINRNTHLFFKDLNRFYIENKALWELDYDYKGFNWIEADNSDQSVLIFDRRSRNYDETLIFVINFTSTVYYDYQIGVPFLGEYEEAFNTDDNRYGGSGQVMDGVLVAEKVPYQKQPYSIKIKVPPMATLILKVKEIKKEEFDSLENLEIEYKDVSKDKKDNVLF